MFTDCDGVSVLLLESAASFAALGDLMNSILVGRVISADRLQRSPLMALV